MLVQRLKPMPRICRFFDNNCDMWGVQVIGALRAMPDTMVHSIELSHFIEPPEGSKEFTPDKVDYLIKHQSIIPRTDARALREVDNEIIRLVGIKADRISKGLDITQVESDLVKLADYRRENTYPNGRIRSFGTEGTKTYQRHMTAIRRLLEKAKSECPEAYYYVKAHLLTGMYFFWSSEEIPHKESLPKRKPHKRTRGKSANRKSQSPRHF